MDFLHIPEEIKEEFTVDSDGKAYLSQAALARLCDVTKQSLNELIQRIASGKSLSKSLQPFAGIDYRKEKLNSNITKAIVSHYYFKNKFTEKGCRFLNFPIPPKKKKNKKVESFYRDKLCQQLGGEKEVLTVTGYIDLLTESEIIEVKAVKSWKEALGQILIYGHYYPNHKKRVHLFGKIEKSQIKLIETHYSKFNVSLTWEK